MTTLIKVPALHCSRPRKVSDVSHQEEVVAALEKALESANVSYPDSAASQKISNTAFSVAIPKTNSVLMQLPHLLFYGPPGTGKTTAALAIARQLFGYDFAVSFSTSIVL